MRAAVTGATGFVGSHLVEALRGRGAEVTALVRRPAQAEALRRLGLRPVLGDLSAGGAVESLVVGAEVVFHAAGLVAARSLADFSRVNHDGTAALAAASRRAGVSRFVYVSSLAVTGPGERQRPLGEGDGPGPVSAYGRSKQAGESAVRSSGTPFTIIRPPAVYGPRDRGFLGLFRMASRGFVPLLGDGDQELSLVHARDLASALVAAGTASATRGGTYHAAHPEPTTQRALARVVGQALGKRSVRLVVVPRGLVRVALTIAGAAMRAAGITPLLDGDKARELLAPAWTCSSAALVRDSGWTARVPLGQGVHETALAYREARWLQT